MLVVQITNLQIINPQLCSSTQLCRASEHLLATNNFTVLVHSHLSHQPRFQHATKKVQCDLLSSNLVFERN